MENQVVFVSGLFDIGRSEIPDEGFKRVFDFYKNAALKLFKIKHPLVFYTTPDLNDWVWQHRSRENTVIINKTLAELRAFPFYNQVQKIRNNPAWSAQAAWLEYAPQHALDLYSILSFHKFWWVNDATLFNHFNSKYYVWVDAGLGTTCGDLDYYFDADFPAKIIPHLERRVMFVGFPYQADAPEVHGFTKNALNNYAGILDASGNIKPTEYVCRGGLFGGNKESINDMNDSYYHLLNDTLNAGYLGTEESIFTILAHKYSNKCKVNYIDGNGLIVKFLEELKHSPIPQKKDKTMAWYYLTFNTPKQFEETLQIWKKGYSKEFKDSKKYVVNNSNDPQVESEYNRIFTENEIEVIHQGENLGICSGRQLVAEHFDKSAHDYYVFFEEDMGCYTETGLCKNGFQTYHKGVFGKAIDILNDEKLDFLRLTFTEFFGGCDVSWNYINFPKEKKDVYYPPKEGYLATKSYTPNTLNKIKVDYLGFYKGLPYAVGNFHYSNWPILFNKVGNRKVFLDTIWKFQYEQNWMSHVGMLWEDKKVKLGCLLISPIKHERNVHYDGSRRRENSTYTN